MMEKVENMRPQTYGIFGPPGTMKTSAALTWPKPMVYFDLNWGIQRGYGMRQDGEVWLYRGEQSVKVMRYMMPSKSFTQRYQALDGFLAAWVQFTKDYVAAMEDRSVASIVVDTETTMRELCCDAFLEDLQKQARPGEPMRRQLTQFDYTEPNRREQGMLDLAQAYGKNLVLVLHETDEYVPVVVAGHVQVDERGVTKTMVSGRKLPDGFKRVPALVDWLFQAQPGEPGQKSKAVVMKSSGGIDLVGALTVEALTYPELVRRLRQLERI